MQISMIWIAFPLSFVLVYNTCYPAMEALISGLTLCYVIQVWVDDGDDQAEALAMVVRTGVSRCMI